MKIGDIDLYALPKWMNAVFEHVEHQCEGELMHESEIYRRIIEEEKEVSEDESGNYGTSAQDRRAAAIRALYDGPSRRRIL